MDQKKESNNDIDKVIDIDNDKNPQEAQKNDNNKNEIEIQISNSNQQGQIGKGGQARIPGAKTLQKNVNSAMKKYDPYQIPADQHIAELHQKSLRVGPPVLTSTEFCPCCARKVDREPLGINCSLHKFAYLGAGTPLFFMFIKFVILFMVILLIVTGIYNAISSAVLGDYCESDQVKEDLTEEEIQNFCEKNWITLFSLGNKADENNLMNISAILNLVACLIIMGLLQLFRYKQRQWQKELDEIDIAPDDYSVMVKNINFDFKLEQGQKYQTVLEEFLENNLFLDKDGKPQSSEVTNVNLCFKMDEFMKLRQNRKKIKQDLSLLIEKEKETGKWDSKKSKEEHEAKLKDIRTQMKEIQQKFHSSEDQEFIRKHFTGFAFVSFHTEQEKDRCLEEQKGIQYFGLTIKNKNARKFKGKNLIIKPAAKPRDVYWQNFHLSKKSILIRNTLGMLSIFPLLAICFVISYYIMKQQKDLEEDNSDGGGPIQTLLALNYDIENPATRAIARQELIEYKKNKLINKTPQDGQLNDIENKVSEKNSNTSQSNLLNKEKINKVVPF
ncbi:hypothetical protein PPERSA_01216 [Pseudocohnilembus persalinus]|uniref:CSC1/OSCA1-like cytosolic domain-containing protein n=1 Tax=Pseudocohnilembus persalinus TaxID=266149 RepID=A0A0V0R969_PSEPJ|nr:hypothetical protein PPERSA_01216 [Pseudocohnilembus persalinus]|eukprot:KRX11017.1 hypothetical protein PPERSA_01216 [Pseudocohnilembus persalinus]